MGGEGSGQSAFQHVCGFEFLQMFNMHTEVFDGLRGGEILAHCFTCQSAEASVSQPCVLLHLLQLLHVQAELQQRGTGQCDAAVMKRGVTQTFVSDLVDGFIAGVLQPQVDHGVLERPAHVELQRQIIHPLNTWERRKTPQHLLTTLTHQ